MLCVYALASCALVYLLPKQLTCERRQPVMGNKSFERVPCLPFTHPFFFLFPVGVRTEQDLFVRLIDSVTKQVRFLPPSFNLSLSVFLIIQRNSHHTLSGIACIVYEGCFKEGLEASLTICKPML